MDFAGCSLAELIDDPLISLLMKSDGVDRRELELLLKRAARTAIAGAPILRNAGKPSRQQAAADPDHS
jgi:hypothetical protein